MASIEPSTGLKIVVFGVFCGRNTTYLLKERSGHEHLQERSKGYTKKLFMYPEASIGFTFCVFAAITEGHDGTVG
jgi:hypothetical protein